MLPNNPNVVMAAERAAELSDKEARVVACTSPQAGLVALVEVDQDASLDQNAERMREALAEIRIGSIAPAARDDTQGRFVAGDAVGFAGEEIVAWGGAGSTLARRSRAGRGRRIVTVIGGVERSDPARRARGSRARRGRARAAGRRPAALLVAAGGPVMQLYLVELLDEAFEAHGGRGAGAVCRRSRRTSARADC